MTDNKVIAYSVSGKLKVFAFYWGNMRRQYYSKQTCDVKVRSSSDDRCRSCQTHSILLQKFMS